MNENVIPSPIFWKDAERFRNYSHEAISCIYFAAVRIDRLGSTGFRPQRSRGAIPRLHPLKAGLADRLLRSYA